MSDCTGPLELLVKTPARQNLEWTEIGVNRMLVAVLAFEFPFSSCEKTPTSARSYSELSSDSDSQLYLEERARNEPDVVANWTIKAYENRGNWIGWGL